jgi:hypothetical protein
MSQILCSHKREKSKFAVPYFQEEAKDKLTLKAEIGNFQLQGSRPLVVSGEVRSAGSMRDERDLLKKV